MIPLHLLAECLQHYHRNSSVYSNLSETINTCKSSVYQSLLELQQYRAQRNDRVHTLQSLIIKTSIWLAILLTMPAYIWYLSVNLTSMSNLTAIYNTGCFFAYLFSILMLGDRIIATKVGAVLLCLLGVLAMAYWPEGSDNNNSYNGFTITNTWVGIFVAALGAAFYGFYEVYYKKYASPPTHPTILFANMVTGVIGIVTFLILWIPFPILHFTGIETFVLPDKITFGYILAIASMSVIYNATFMAVIALTNPVFAAVGVMLTVPAVAIADVFVTGVMVPISTIVGSTFILVGFFILNRQVGKDDENIDNTSPLTLLEEQNLE